MLHEYASRFHGFDVVEIGPDSGDLKPDLAYRLRLDYEEAYGGQEATRELYESPPPPDTLMQMILRKIGLGRTRKPLQRLWSTVQPKQTVFFRDKLKSLLENPKATNLRALIIGDWRTAYEEGESNEIVAAIAASGDKLKGLEALFIGDIIGEECELSWIVETDMSPLWAALPNLREFRVRGGTGLSLGDLRHERLSRLVIESGGLPANVVKEIGQAQLPNLEHLELWLGERNYGWDGNVEDFAPIFSGEPFPALRHLGLRNFENTDALAKLLADAPILDRIESLDLSLGTLGDEGAAALSASPKVARLIRLDIHHHYVSDKELEPLRALGIELNVDDQNEPDEYDGESYRYIFAGE